MESKSGFWARPRMNTLREFVEAMPQKLPADARDRIKQRLQKEK